ncbi:hypothetical protein NDA14_001644 [Ustilago hordei]|uniref:Uncharacterized protein n=1 Tax=Ustilago hordei TaxID=120017 RepID=I2G424_USTHO|nr:uncharacterized protein UHO2_01036 [Ustilago hordei]KAJ1043474.1 hypothetical protein NDA10_006947 [Ustilago hordei]KAJ1583448.1 hypothetical protein NDA15_003622 [Ustilago hordei]KAJ1591659.1 hypothetical protein NDA12_001928 [Ustilago hordei]KAJ1602879.1 hypothetical protein NDA14_001644 [Ustilago hordei]UTT95063.1 hypothetical protein NDA17_000836 [Ustilago hordei]
MRRVTYLGEECGDDMVLTTGRRARDYQDARALEVWAVGSGQWAVGGGGDDDDDDDDDDDGGWLVGWWRRLQQGDCRNERKVGSRGKDD